MCLSWLSIERLLCLFSVDASPNISLIIGVAVGVTAFVVIVVIIVVVVVVVVVKRRRRARASRFYTTLLYASLLYQRRFELLGRVGRGLQLVPGLPKRNSARRTPLLLAYPKFDWLFDWPTQMKIPRTAPVLYVLLNEV